MGPIFIHTRSSKIYNVEQLYKLKVQTRNQILERIYTKGELMAAEGYQAKVHNGFISYELDCEDLFLVATKIKTFLEQEEASGELLRRQLKLKGL
jgi:hypothetical protein